MSSGDIHMGLQCQQEHHVRVIERVCHVGGIPDPTFYWEVIVVHSSVCVMAKQRE